MKMYEGMATNLVRYFKRITKARKQLASGTNMILVKNKHETKISCPEPDSSGCNSGFLHVSSHYMSNLPKRQKRPMMG